MSSLAALEEVGTALYGSDWRSPMARDLGVSKRAVFYWLAWEAVPDKAAAALPGVLLRHAALREGDALRLRKLAARLGTRTNSCPLLPHSGPWRRSAPNPHTGAVAAWRDDCRWGGSSNGRGAGGLLRSSS